MALKELEKKRQIADLTLKKINSVSQETITIDIQKKILNALKNTGVEQFYFVMDLRSLRLSHSNGFLKCLGISDNLMWNDYLQLIHPSMNDLQMLYDYFLHTELSGTGAIKEFMMPKFISILAMKHRNKNFHLIKRTTTPFQIDTTGQPTAYLNVFQIISEYQGEPMQIRIIDFSGNRYHDLENTFKQFILDNAKYILPFSKKELMILKLMAEEPYLDNDMLAEKQGVKKTTIQTLNTRILKKANYNFGLEFDTGAKVAAFLKAQMLF